MLKRGDKVEIVDIGASDAFALKTMSEIEELSEREWEIENVLVGIESQGRAGWYKGVVLCLNRERGWYYNFHLVRLRKV
jgi:hypothetical protein